ncbi:MAG: pyruvate synthase [Candidatus Altiarchaeales archaeon]|nr:MAG: pyruvate synthase [Candidatus Altiarchaeales archaeon]RLI95021.1 MAG: pyruvate synthase [Candidatus Altiarchaeales archaeon]HDO82375.1 4Fe-4S dicluster domain-containing protein [Candidatus Altiarchaeales archaeon]HEX55024.1 4Fe-4S dicluster domain-containing protein [Candidatus Altiarchaeales archaeon]
MINFENIKLKVNDKEITIGAVLESNGSVSNLKTGAWRSKRPVTNLEKCTGCGVCWSLCPEGCIVKRDNGKFETNLDYCKGCGICANECPTNAIEMLMEEK